MKPLSPFYSAQGEITLEDNAFYLKIDNQLDSKTKYFDFSQHKGNNYDISFNMKDTVCIFKAIVDDIIRTKNDIKVYVFRINNGFSYEGHFSDLIFFVTKENGVIGSYISDGDWMVAIRGDVLRDYIDYSHKHIGVIE